MAIESAVLLPRVSFAACLTLAAHLLFPGVALAQPPFSAPVPVTVGSVVPFGYRSTSEWSQIHSVKVAHNGTAHFWIQRSATSISGCMVPPRLPS